MPGADAQAYCAYLGDLSTLCVEAESLEERCTGALRCGCCTTSREPDAHGRMLMQSSLDVPAVLVQVQLVMRVHIIPPVRGLATQCGLPLRYRHRQAAPGPDTALPRCRHAAFCMMPGSFSRTCTLCIVQRYFLIGMLRIPNVLLRVPRLLANAYSLHIAHLTTGMRIGAAAAEKLDLFPVRAPSCGSASGNSMPWCLGAAAACMRLL